MMDNIPTYAEKKIEFDLSIFDIVYQKQRELELKDKIQLFPHSKAINLPIGLNIITGI